MNDKELKAQKLFSAIGEIDDELVYEAQSYKKPRLWGVDARVLAACFAVFMAVAIAIPLINGMNGLGQASKPCALDLVMLELRDGDYLKLQSFDELSYVGEASIVWQYEDDGEIYVKSLSPSQLTRLTRELGKGERAGETSPEILCKVWVLDGRGNVRTPYLESTNGNVGCEIFDFDAEIIPGESVVNCISDIMS